MHRFVQKETSVRPLHNINSAWRCAAVVLAVATGSVALNLAGCGGGGGDSSSGGIIGNTPVVVTFQLQDENGTSTSGSVTINGTTVTSNTSSVVFPNLTPGTYSVTFVVNTTPATTTTATVVVGNESTQTYTLTSGVTGVSGKGTTIIGRVQLNPGSTSTNNCTSTSSNLSAALLIRVRDLNSINQPVVASVIKPDQTASTFTDAQRGRFVIPNVPGPGTYRVEVRQIPGAVAPFTGRSAQFTIGSTPATLTLPNICANASNSAPGDVPDANTTATPTPTSTSTVPGA